ncbi:SH3 domain-containing protein [Paucimonas lemoignei]|uniref:SH3 domain-containing protein n=1 Tax=Paucimonas lemoignei TaxID=29443 RepID=A0A4R3HRA1_PAULE|nr:SH3 domain-containing protein [Paucimonas lemoignei]TCS33484.1 SH3 domain-containing protein [Paucimonas lemoignei]
MKAYALALMLVACVVHAEPALTNRATDMLAQPLSDANKLGSLAENDRVEVLRRSGAWSEVKTGAGKTGWVRMMHLKPVNAAGSAGGGSSNPVSALANLMNSGRTSNTATVTTGVKGFQEEELRRAQANPEEFRKMQKYAASKDAGMSFARNNKLNAASVEYLQGQAATPSGNGNSNDSAIPGMTGG